jgi:hypothetical protein
MRSPLSGSIATCLIFVPLVAVPLLAVLGMPQLSSSATSTPGDDLKFVKDEPAQAAGNAELVDPVRISDSRSESPAPNREAPTREAHVRESRSGARNSDPFAEFTRDSDGSQRHAATASSSGSSPKRPQRWLNEGNGLPQKALFSSEGTNEDRAAATPSDRPAPSGSLEDHPSEQPSGEAPDKLPVARRALPEAQAVVTNDSESAAVTPPADAPSEAGAPAESRASSNHAFAWKKAVGRLNALGIRDYQLQPGERAGEFNFSCRFAARSNPRVIHRFEAESADPLDAVNQVLRQLDDWRARHSERGQAARGAATEGNLTSRVAGSSEVEITNRAF